MNSEKAAKAAKYPAVLRLKAKDLNAQVFVPNEQSRWRYETLFIKEPETIEWLGGLTADDVLWDVGANIGIYTLYAALVAGCRVIAVEPGAANYWTLCKNIEINRLDDRVTAYCIALGEEHRVADLYLHVSTAGGAQNALDRPQTDTGEVFVPKAKQGMLSIPADVLVGSLGASQPTAIKIDVDGFELFVLRGAKEVLASPVLRRISLEMDSANADLVSTATGLLIAAGFAKTGEHRSPNVYPNSPIHNFHYERT